MVKMKGFRRTLFDLLVLIFTIKIGRSKLFRISPAIFMFPYMYFKNLFFISLIRELAYTARPMYSDEAKNVGFIR